MQQNRQHRGHHICSKTGSTEDTTNAAKPATPRTPYMEKPAAPRTPQTQKTGNTEDNTDAEKLLTTPTTRTPQTQQNQQHRGRHICSKTSSTEDAIYAAKPAAPRTSYMQQNRIYGVLGAAGFATYMASSVMPVLLHIWRPRCCRFCCICGVLVFGAVSSFFCVCGALGVTGFLLRLWCPRCCRFYYVCDVSGLSFEMPAISSHTHTHGGAPLVFGDWTS